MLHLHHIYQKKSIAYLQTVQKTLIDIAMPMYNLLEYSDNHSMTSRNLWNYYRDEVNDDENESDNANSSMNNDKTITTKSLECKTKLIGTTPNDNNTLNAEVAVSFKHLSNFWKFFYLPMINYKIELHLPWLKESILSKISITFRIPAILAANPPVQKVAAIQTTGSTFQINNT